MQTKEQILVEKKEEEKIFTKGYNSIIISDLALRICSYMQSAVIPLYVLDKGYSTTFAGLTTTAFMLMAIIALPVSGNMVDTRGRYIVLIIGSLIYFFSTGLFLLTFPIWVLLVFRALQGLGFSFVSTGSNTLATDIIPESKMAEGISYRGLTQTLGRFLLPVLP